MPNLRKGIAGRKKSAGTPLKPRPSRRKHHKTPKLPAPAPQLLPQRASKKKVILVHDSAGKIVSVTQVAPDARHGVGIKPNPGHTVKEFEVTGALAETPLGEIREKYGFDLKTGALIKGRP